MSKMYTLDEIEIALGEDLFNETSGLIKKGQRTSVGRDWIHDQKIFDDLCSNLGYVPFFTEA